MRLFLPFALCLGSALGASATSSSELDAWLQRTQAARSNELRSPASAPTARELQAGLGENELILVFGPSSTSQLAVAALRRDATLGPLPLDYAVERLERDVERLHSLLRSGSRPARGQLLRLTDALGDSLLGPVSELLPGAEAVRLLTSPPLDELPFAALRLPRSVDEQREHWVTRAQLCHLVTLMVPSSARRAPRTVLGGADPEFRRSELPLGASMSDAGVSWRRSAARRLEIEALGENFPTTLRLLGTELTAQALREAGAVDLLHLAADVEQGGDFERAALALSSGDPGARPKRLRLRDAREWSESEGGLAVITGLSRTRSELSAGQENARNFLTSPQGPEQRLHSATHLAATLHGAGFSQVLTTLWRVPDESAPAFFRTFYEGLSNGRSAGAALRRAQRRMIESPVDAGGSGGPRIDAREPLFWAGFRLYSNCR